MKINWGTGIVIAFVLFMSFILFFIIKASTQEKYSYDLVSEEYYKDELNYQSDIDKYNNTKELGVVLKFLKIPEGIEVVFPNNYQTITIKGNMSLYRPSNQSLDLDIPFVLSKQTTLLIPDNKLVGGRWDIKVHWTQQDKEFLYKKEFVY
tara:strand:- start:422907 stop:423356 length:450 start_codon:yes stop_codon:yes gene_type:complete